MGVVSIALKALGVVLLLLLAAAGVAYAMDYTIGATVTETRCGEDQVDVRTDLLSIDYTAKVPRDQCALLGVGNYVDYRIRSRHITVYEREGGRCLFDSETGLYCGESSGPPPFPFG